MTIRRGNERGPVGERWRGELRGRNEPSRIAHIYRAVKRGQKGLSQCLLSNVRKKKEQVMSATERNQGRQGHLIWQFSHEGFGSFGKRQSKVEVDS